MAVDIGELLPLIGVGMLAATTLGSIVGAYALGRSRRPGAPSLPREHAVEERIERVERLMETMAIEIERIGEGQRFMTRVMTERGLPSGADPAAPRASGRVITPH